MLLINDDNYPNQRERKKERERKKPHLVEQELPWRINEMTNNKQVMQNENSGFLILKDERKREAAAFEKRRKGGGIKNKKQMRNEPNPDRVRCVKGNNERLRGAVFKIIKG